MNSIIFHLAFPVHDLATARAFYIDKLGFSAGRTSEDAIIMNIGGHQCVAQLTEDPISEQKGIYPRHFGLIFSDQADWEALLNRARAQSVEFYGEPRTRLAGKPVEHKSFFLRDPSGNLIEFKHYKNTSAVFGEHSTPHVGDEDRQT